MIMSEAGDNVLYVNEVVNSLRSYRFKHSLLSSSCVNLSIFVTEYIISNINNVFKCTHCIQYFKNHNKLINKSPNSKSEFQLLHYIYYAVCNNTVLFNKEVKLFSCFNFLAKI